MSNFILGVIFGFSATQLILAFVDKRERAKEYKEYYKYIETGKGGDYGTNAN